ncbi:helix-turn-helix domain-containing protein [Streptosporangium saharense]|uniref:AraC-like DNA-binding protein n=1 Tax=Streptosporangium saharense TaxID=1706840 RepID=A0A7W7QPU5_9ACTN|nr:helix-turn-helix domain-containing protein [Streptosporangium saharense]MBB4917575.1 AraC-like DNA-binding protein [Streptosporangium saharense]
MTYVPTEDVGMLVLRLPRHLMADSASVERLKDAVRHTAADFVEASSGSCEGLLPRIRTYIDDNLGDPNLSPETVAAAHHISTSYLYKIFARQGISVARWIRQRRLERCRKDLSDPRLGGRAVGEVGAQWGFVDSSYFSRVFRQTYGCSPRAYRHALRAS